MIFTITINTAIDHVISLDESLDQETVQATQSNLYAAGKGVNVSRAIESIGGTSTAVCLVGNETESIFNDLKSSQSTDYQFISVPGTTRFNVTLKESYSGKISHIRTNGYCVSESHLTQVRDTITASTEQGDFVVISGSLPKRADVSAYHDLIVACQERRAKVILDSSGEEFARGIQALPYLIKPNITELSDLLGYKIDNTDEGIVRALYDSALDGLDNIVVSRGAKGAIAYSHREDVILKVWLDRPLSNSIVNPVGSGDAMIGGIVMALNRDQSFEEAITNGVICGTANLVSATPGWCDFGVVKKIRRHVKVKKLDR